MAAVLLIAIAMLAASIAPSVGSTDLSSVVPDSVASVVDTAFGIESAEAGFWGAVAGAAVGAFAGVSAAFAITAVVTNAPVWLVVGGVVLMAGVGAVSGYHATPR